MFRLVFVLTLLYILGSLGSSQNKSVKKTSENVTEHVLTVGDCKDGRDGRNGQNGNDGRDGKDGKDGRDGRNGKSCVKGEKGEQGLPGQKGMPGTCDAKCSLQLDVFQKEVMQYKEEILTQINGLVAELNRFKNESNQTLTTSCDKHSLSGFRFFEKVQDLPTKGAVAVEQFKIGGGQFLAFANYRDDIHRYKTTSVIYKMDDLTDRFTPYQTLQTRGAHDIKYFSIADKHFLAVANHHDGLIYQLDSVIYQWNGNRFVVFQTIRTIGGIHLTFFAIEAEQYLAVANHHDGSTYSLKSVIYKWKNDKFDKFQEIATEGARGCTVFVINNDTFIAFANNYNSQQKHSVHSSVFKWSGGHFVKLQTLQTYGAYDVESFQINGHTFLVFANFYSGSKYNTDSFIYKWDGNKFALFQSIPTRGAAAWHSFVICGQTYLSVANQNGDSQKQNTLSVVYQASGAQFNKYQEIPTHGARDMTSFEYKGHIYLAVANAYNGQNYNINSALYKWV